MLRSLLMPFRFKNSFCPFAVAVGCSFVSFVFRLSSVAQLVVLRVRLPARCCGQVVSCSTLRPLLMPYSFKNSFVPVRCCGQVFTCVLRPSLPSVSQIVVLRGCGYMFICVLCSLLMPFSFKNSFCPFAVAVRSSLVS